MAETDAQEVPPNYEEVFYCVGDCALEELSRETVESPALQEIFKNHLGTILSHVLYDDSASAGWFDQMTQRGPFQPVPFCDLAVRSGIKIRQTPDSISSYNKECTLPTANNCNIRAEPSSYS